MNFVSGVLMEQCYEQRFTPWCRCVILGIPLLFWTVPLICFDCSMLARLTCMMISSLNIHIAACQRIFSETDHLFATICFQPLEYRLLSWTWSYRLLSWTLCYGMLHCRDYQMMVSSTRCLSLEFLHLLIDIATYMA